MSEPEGTRHRCSGTIFAFDGVFYGFRVYCLCVFKWRWLLYWFPWPEVSNGWNVSVGVTTPIHTACLTTLSFLSSNVFVDTWPNRGNSWIIIVLDLCQVPSRIQTCDRIRLGQERERAVQYLCISAGLLKLFYAPICHIEACHYIQKHTSTSCLILLVCLCGVFGWDKSPGWWQVFF